RLTVERGLREFIEHDVLPGTGVEPARFFAGLGDAMVAFAPRNAALLAHREHLQAQIDAWHTSRPGHHDPDRYAAFLREIGYLAPPVEPFHVTTRDVDPEIARQYGPQLV